MKCNGKYWHSKVSSNFLQSWEAQEAEQNWEETVELAYIHIHTYVNMQVLLINTIKLIRSEYSSSSVLGIALSQNYYYLRVLNY